MIRSRSVLALVMLPNLVLNAVVSIVDCMMWRIDKGVNSRNPVSETYPFTETVIIV